MMRECIVLNGEVINIGSWDYMLQRVEVKPAEFDGKGNIVKEAMYEERATNPLPEGAEIVEMEIMEVNTGGKYPGLFPSNYVCPLSPTEQRIADIELVLADLLSGGIE